MNTDISEIDNEAGEMPAPEKKPRGKGAVLAFMTFVFALAALGGTGWLWWQGESDRQQDDDRIDAKIEHLESAYKDLSVKQKQVREELKLLADNDTGSQIAALQKQLAADHIQVSSLDQTVRDQLALSRSLQTATESIQGRLLASEAAIAGLSSNELDAGKELDLAEVDYLLRLANERLKLFSDPDAADQALELADMHLAAMDNPMYLSVRKEIATARRELAAVNIPDYVLIDSQLNAIQESVVSLPFRGEVAVSQESEAVQETDWWEKVKSVFSNLVTIRRSTAQENERISLQDMDYIRQRLWLQLEMARLSLMRREQGAFSYSLERARKTLSTWFDTGDDSYRSVDRSINELMALKIKADLPDISTPWATIRLVREGRPRPAPAPSVPAPSAAVSPEHAVDTASPEHQE